MNSASPSVPSESIRPPRPVRRILLIQQRQIGDVLLATPAVELTARRFPEARIHLLTEKKCAPLLRGNPHIRTIWEIDKSLTLLQTLKFYRQVAAAGFDLLADFQQLPRGLMVVALSRAPVRLTFPAPWHRRLFYTHFSPFQDAYAAASKAGMLAPLGIAWNGERPRIYLTEEERAEAARFYAQTGLDRKTVVSVDATHKSPTRRWPAGHYAALMDAALETARPGRDLAFLLGCGPGEEKDIAAIRELCRHKESVFLAPGPPDLRRLAALIEAAAMQFGNCSAPRHIAVAVNTPSLTILGASGNGWTFPSPEHAIIRARDFMAMPCQPCKRGTCSNALACLAGLTPEMALPRFLGHLERFARR